MVFPLYDDNPFKRATPPLVTWGLIAVNVLVFLCELGAPDSIVASIDQTYGVIPARIFHPREPGLFFTYLPLVTSMFLHGGWEHILGNMVFLFVFGDDIEDALGSLRFLAFYLLVGIAAALVFALADPTSTKPLIGASGAVSGVLAAYLMLRPCAHVTVLLLVIVLTRVRVRAYWVIGGWILLQLYYIAAKAHSDVAYVAHLGGLVAGVVLFLAMKPAGVRLLDCIPQEGEEPA